MKIKSLLLVCLTLTLFISCEKEDVNFIENEEGFVVNSKYEANRSSFGSDSNNYDEEPGYAYFYVTFNTKEFDFGSHDYYRNIIFERINEEKSYINLEYVGKQRGENTIYLNREIWRTVEYCGGYSRNDKPSENEKYLCPDVVGPVEEDEDDDPRYEIDGNGGG